MPWPRADHQSSPIVRVVRVVRVSASELRRMFNDRIFLNKSRAVSCERRQRRTFTFPNEVPHHPGRRPPALSVISPRSNLMRAYVMTTGVMPSRSFEPNPDPRFRAQAATLGSPSRSAKNPPAFSPIANGQPWCHQFGDETGGITTSNRRAGACPEFAFIRVYSRP